MFKTLSDAEERSIEEITNMEKAMIEEMDKQFLFILSIQDGFEEFISEQEDILRRF